MDYDLVDGDNALLSITCVDANDTPIPLDGAAVELIWIGPDGNMVTESADIVDAAGGVVQYRFSANQVYAPEMQIEVKITDGVGNVLRSLHTVDFAVRNSVEK